MLLKLEHLQLSLQFCAPSSPGPGAPARKMQSDGARGSSGRSPSPAHRGRSFSEPKSSSGSSVCVFHRSTILKGAERLWPVCESCH